MTEDHPPIFVIHRKQDEARAAFVKQAYKKAGLKFIFFDATDGHGEIKDLAPFKNLLPTRFWNENEIKIGAFACFISHYRLWKKIVNEGIESAVIAEDDTAPIEDFHLEWRASTFAYQSADVVFLNNRICVLADGQPREFSEVIAPKILSGKLHHRAPGGDGYWISREGAQKLINFAHENGVFCGVDWAILAAAWDTREIKMRDLKESREMKLIYKNIGARKPALTAIINHPHLFELRKGFASTLNHNRKISIDALKTQL